MDLSRRNMLKGVVSGAAGTAVTGGMLIGGARADAAAAGGGAQTVASYAFHGPHQAGIDTQPQQPRSVHAAFDLTAASRADLITLFQTLTSRARHLTTGGQVPSPGVGSPPADSDVLGPSVPADGLTVTVSVGPGLFDSRFGLAGMKPRLLEPMRTFPNDALEYAWCGGDILLMICANNSDTVHHALRDIAKHTRAWMQPRWRIDGFVSPPRPTGAPRNLLGFKDGIANPSGAEFSRLVWVVAGSGSGSGEPAWASGGSYHVVRLIRMFSEFWDRVSLNEQQNMFGRFRDSGATLDSRSGNENEPPDYAADPSGAVIPLDSHIRLANPRVGATEPSRIYRRGFNYDLGFDANGNIQCGLVFNCFQTDPRRQFEAVQTRLINEPLSDYIQPFGGGYFYALPGVRSSSDWYARGLLA